MDPRPTVGQWTNHFKRFAHRAFPQEDMYVVNQSGRGLGGRNAYKPTVYKIRGTPDAGPPPPVAIVSDVAANIERARAEVKRESLKEGGGKKKRSSSSSARRGHKKKKTTTKKKVTQKPKKKSPPKKKRK